MTERNFSTADLANAGENKAAEEDRLEETSQPDAASDAEIRSSAPESPTEDAAADAASAPLFPAEEADRFRKQWVETQGEFVDEPRQAVEQADHLVAELMQRLATQFSETRSELERRWDGQENVSTEDLRVAMTQYRSFFERLLQA
jgi:hypothetical protein